MYLASGNYPVKTYPIYFLLQPFDIIAIRFHEFKLGKLILKDFFIDTLITRIRSKTATAEDLITVVTPCMVMLLKFDTLAFS